MIVIGIDVSKDKLDCLWLRNPETLKVKSKVVGNNLENFKKLCQWVKCNTDSELNEVLFVMEATGIYHEPLAYFLHQTGAKVAVVNPAWVRDYAKSLGIRTKNDKKDSLVLARYGASQSIGLWQPEPQEIRDLKALLSRLNAVEKDVRREENRMEKALCGQESTIVMDSIDNMLKSLQEEKKRLDKMINDHIDGNPALKEDSRLLKSIPGIGDVVSRYMIVVFRGRTFQKAGQMAAYLGLVPIEYESGTSVRGKPRLSKSGNGVIRAKLYMPAVVAAHCNPDASALYQRLVNNGKPKKAAIGAVMRKMVHICFGVLKHQQTYSSQAV